MFLIKQKQLGTKTAALLNAGSGSKVSLTTSNQQLLTTTKATTAAEDKKYKDFEVQKPTFNYQNSRKQSSTDSTNSTNNKNVMQRLKGKVAIVTASTDGIGFAIAKRLAEDGACVVISSRKEANVNKAVEQLNKLNLNVFGLKCHVGVAQDRKKLFEETINKYGKLNILVSNAATNPAVGGVLECDEGVWDKIFDVNVKSSFLLAKEALPYLRKEKDSSITFISSIGGLDPFELLGAYSVSKTALIGLTKAAAKELAPEGIRVNCLAPGVIKTKFSQALYESETAYEATIEKIPMCRLGMPEEMAGVVSFLVSNDASYITGETIVASGGMTSRL